MTGRECGNYVVDTGIGDGRPRGGADVPPECLFGGEGVQLGGCTCGGGEGGAVEAGEDVGHDYVRVDGGDGGVAALIKGSCCSTRSHFFLLSQLKIVQVLLLLLFFFFGSSSLLGACEV